MRTTLKAVAGAAALLALLPASAMAQVKLDPGIPIGEFPVRHPVIVPPTPVVVSVGDSAISGEAGRWAGNTKIVAPPIADALGPHAYDDNAAGTGEATPGCHRSKSAEVHITADGNGNTVQSVNFACSGAKSDSYIEGSSGNFKPGLDFNNVGNQKGQAQLLQEYATAHPRAIKAVAVLNGANEFGFADIAGTCAQHFIETPYL